MIVFDDGNGYGNALYVGGKFTNSYEQIGIKNIARWDGSHWSQVGKGSNSTVYAFAIYDDGSGPALYASGQFPNTDGINVDGIGRWDGKEWLIVPSGDVSNGSDFTAIFNLQVFDDAISDRPALYIGGRFNMIGSIAANHIVRWDGNSWSPLGSGFGPSSLSVVHGMTVFDDGGSQGESLYINGDFLTADGISSKHFAQWIPCINPILGDLNGDGSVNTTDLLILFANWGQTDSPADFNNDGTVDELDLILLLNNWG